MNFQLFKFENFNIYLINLGFLYLPLAAHYIYFIWNRHFKNTLI